MMSVIYQILFYLPFLYFTSLSDKSFDKVHYDVWGSILCSFMTTSILLYLLMITHNLLGYIFLNKKIKS
jgi:hypothetical protein